MAFAYTEHNPQSFSSLTELKKFVKETEQAIEKVLLSDLIKQEAHFFDDARFGTTKTNYGFTEQSFKRLCQHFAIPTALIEGISESGLASTLLNDFLKNNKGRLDIENTVLIVDNSQNQILGLVSGTYVFYSNIEFIENVEDFLGSWEAQKQQAQLDSAYYYNTHLYVRLLTKIEVGIVTGRGGIKNDVTRIGLQLTNSMIGDLPVRVAFYLYRLLCANGIVAQVSELIAMVKHSGYRESFDIRFQERVNALLAKVHQMKYLIDSLAEIIYNPQQLVKTGFANAILDIVPEMRSTLRQKINLEGESDIKDAKVRKIWRETKYLDAIPTVYGREHSLKVFNSSWRDNASMFDFINVLTEYAKELPVMERLQVEESVGEFADYVLENISKLKGRV